MAVTTITILKVCGGILAGTFFLALGITYYLTLPWVKVTLEEKPEYMDVVIDVKRANRDMRTSLFLLGDVNEIGSSGVVSPIDMGCHYLIVDIKLPEGVKGYWRLYLDDKPFARLKEESILDGRAGYKIYKLTCQPEWEVLFKEYKLRIVEIDKLTFYGYK